MKSRSQLSILGVLIVIAAFLSTACAAATAPVAAPTQAPAAASTQAPPAAAPTQPAAASSAAPTVGPTKAPTLAPTSVPTKPPAPTRTAVPSRTPVPPTPTAAARATAQPARATPAAAATPVSLQAPAGATDCGADLSCFIEASRAGNLAKVDYTMAVDFFGMFVANTDTLMIKAKNGSQLAFSQQTIAADAAMSEAVLAAAEAKGMSGPDIQKALTTAAGVADLMRAANANLTPDQAEQLKPAKESQQARIGTGKECQFPQSALTAMLERWKAGQYSSSDYDPAQCTDIGSGASSGTSISVPIGSATAAPTRTPGPQPAIFGKNLIVNGDAETGASASTNTEKVPPSGWTATGNFTAIKYGTKGVLSAEVAQFENAGASFFAGGPNNAISSATQTIDVTEGAAAIDGGEVRFELGALLGGSGTQADSASVTLTFKSADGKVLDTKTMGPPTPDDRNRVDGYMGFGASHYVPKSTRSIEVKVTMKGTNASSYNDGYADNITLSLVDEAA